MGWEEGQGEGRVGGEGGREGDEGEGREERRAALDAVGKERGRRSRV